MAKPGSKVPLDKKTPRLASRALHREKDKPKDPFYVQVTPVNVGSMDLPMVTLPPGTVLFRGLKVPHLSQGEDVRYFYRDFLGDPEPDGRMCLSPVHNVFFYPFPFVAFGAHDIGVTFTSMQIVVLIHPVTFICAVSPSPLVRGSPRGFPTDVPWKRCSAYQFECHTPTFKEQDAKDFDNCIDPEFQARSGVRGWMAVADLDSFQPKKLLRQGMEAKNVPMSKYIRHLEDVFPGKAAELLANAYTDQHKHFGFPELAIFPYKRHPGAKRIVNGVRSSKKAIQLIEKEIKSSNLNFLPLAAFTKDATVDMVNGKFSFESLGVAENSFSTPPVQHQLPIERRLHEYMDLLQTTGIDLPFYGKGKLSFDARTGFFVLPQLIPRNYRLPTPDESKGIPYSFVVMPLDTPENKKKALTYSLMFRSFIPEKFMQKFGLEKGVAVRRSMIFNRPPVLSKLFEALDLAIPPSFKATLARAAKQYQLNTGVPSKTQQAKAASAAAAQGASAAAGASVAAGANLPPLQFEAPFVPGANFAPLAGTGAQGFYQPRTPTYGNNNAGGFTPPYGADLPPLSPRYGATPPGSPPYGAPGFTPPGSPPYGAESPKSPSYSGGSRKRTLKKSLRKSNKTLKRRSSKPFLHFATDFKEVWSSLAKTLKA
jgi:hypothetical protein